MSAVIRTSGLPASFKPAPQTQAVADEVQNNFGFTSFGTYLSHEPTPELAVDIFVTQADGDRLAPWLVEHIERLGVDYVIWWQRIYNPEIATHWRDMPDRGSDKANHKDHIHVSLEADQGADMPLSTDDIAKVVAAIKGTDEFKAIGPIGAALDELKARTKAIEDKLDAGGSHGAAPEYTGTIALKPKT